MLASCLAHNTWLIRGNRQYKLESVPYSNDLDGIFYVPAVRPVEHCCTYMHTKMCMCTSRCRAVIAKASHC